MNEELFQIPAVLVKASTMGMRSVRMSYDTQENLTDEMLSKSIAHVGKAGHLLFAVERSILPEEVSSLPPLTWDEDNGKSPSVRLRAVLWRLHEQSRPDMDFESFYRMRMTQFIEHVKSKLT